MYIIKVTATLPTQQTATRPYYENGQVFICGTMEDACQKIREIKDQQQYVPMSFHVESLLSPDPQHRES